MPKRKSPEARLAEIIHEIGEEKAESLFQFLKALNSQLVRSEPKQRKKSEKPVVMEAAKAS